MPHNPPLTPNPLFDYIHSPSFGELLRENEKSCDQEGPFTARLMSLQSQYLDTTIVLILEAQKDLLRHPLVNEVQLDYTPLCESNGNEMLVKFRFDLVVTPNPDTPQEKALHSECGYDEAHDDQFLYDVLPLWKKEDVEVLQAMMINLVTAGEHMEPSQWNDFFMSYDLQRVSMKSVSDIDRVYSEHPHLAELRSQFDKFVLNQNMPKKPLASKPLKM